MEDEEEVVVVDADREDDEEESVHSHQKSLAQALAHSPVPHSPLQNDSSKGHRGISQLQAAGR